MSVKMNFGSLFAIAFAGFVALSDAGRGKYTGNPRNFIMVIPDGFGPASETMARHWMHWNNNATTNLPVDQMTIGQIRTRSSDSYVPDSASTATAYSCGLKTYNGGIAVNDDMDPCGTVLEAAKLQGFKTGLIVTSRITHATPASYVAHVYDRDLEANIALQEIGVTHPLGAVVDILMGGGRCFFTPQTTEDSCRDDDIDALDLAAKMGYSVFTDRAGFDTKQTMPYLGLFTQDHMSYEVDRDPEVEPSLTEMAIKGLDDLYAATKSTEKGFFVMVEASRIDHAGHGNDPTGHLHDILEYNNAMMAMRDWIDSHEDSPTTLISTADHECGGLTLGISLGYAPEYWWEPSYFVNSRASSGVLASAWSEYNSTSDDDAREYLIENIYGRYGVTNVTEEEITQGLELKSSTSQFSIYMGNALSSRLGIHWSTTGHSAVDVTLYGHGINHEKFVGQHENTEVADFAASQLQLKLDPITTKIRANKTFVDTYVKPQAGTTRKVRRSELIAHHH